MGVFRCLFVFGPYMTVLYVDSLLEINLLYSIIILFSLKFNTAQARRDRYIILRYYIYLIYVFPEIYEIYYVYLWNYNLYLKCLVCIPVLYEILYDISLFYR